MNMSEQLFFLKNCNNCEYYNESFCSKHRSYKNLNEYCGEYETRSSIKVDPTAIGVTGEELVKCLNKMY